MIKMRRTQARRNAHEITTQHINDTYLITLLRTALVAMVLMLGFEATAQVERGQKSFGPKAGFNTRNSSAIAGLTFDYAFSSHVRIAPSIGIAFRNKDRDAPADRHRHALPNIYFGQGRFLPFGRCDLQLVVAPRHQARVARRCDNASEFIRPQRRCGLGNTPDIGIARRHRGKVHPGATQSQRPILSKDSIRVLEQGPRQGRKSIYQSSNQRKSDNNPRH